MSRWQPDARGRLERAAVELFLSQGFGLTTVPEIADRAGLTTRTFFRHFTDKKEVLFFGQEAFAKAFLDGIDASPTGASPLRIIKRSQTISSSSSRV